MIKISYLRMLIPLLIVGFMLVPQAGSASDLMETVCAAKAALQSGLNSWDSEKMEQAKDIFLGLIEQEPENAFLHYYVALCDYRLATYAFTISAMDQAEACTMDAKEHLERAMEIDPACGELDALYASMLGFEIAFHYDQAMTLGYQIYQHFEQALEKSPENPRVNLLRGLSDLFTPEQYGGGAEKAIGTLEKAVSFFDAEKVEDPFIPSWGKEDAYTFLGAAYKQTGDIEKAREFLKKALEINPDYSYARDELAKLDK